MSDYENLSSRWAVRAPRQVDGREERGEEDEGLSRMVGESELPRTRLDRGLCGLMA